MLLREKLEHSGQWLFRWRSYVPLVPIALLPLAFREYAYPMGSPSLDVVWEIGCFVVSLIGLGIRVHAVGHAPKGTSGRNRRDQVADELNTTGLYSIVRNPLYLGNFLMYIGPALVPRCWWLVALVGLFMIVYYERIIFAEEQFLERKFGEAYVEWARKTPAIFPAWMQWRKSPLPFSWKTALKREYLGFCGLVLTFTLVEMGEHLALGRSLELSTEVLAFALSGLVVFVVVRWMRKRTRVLDEVGR